VTAVEALPSRPGSCRYPHGGRVHSSRWERWTLPTVGLLVLPMAIVCLGRHGYRDSVHPGRPLSVLALSAAALRGAEPDVLDEVVRWQTDDL